MVYLFLHGKVGDRKMAGWKQWVKNGLLAWQRRKYDRLLEEKTMVYDSWIKQVEAERYGADCETEGVMVHQVPYEVCRDYLTKGAMEKDRADVVLFAGGNGRVSDIAKKVTAEYFKKNEGTDLAYGDEDVMGPDGIRYTPWFKPDWSPDTFLSFLLWKCFCSAYGGIESADGRGNKVDMAACGPKRG